jgi:hypothetical protein
VQDLDDETKRQIVDGHIDGALNEIGGSQHVLSRTTFAAEVQRRMTKDICPVPDRIAPNMLVWRLIRFALFMGVQ